jgi:Saxitoxin biosynthesis operon protein SxtJ
MISRRSLHERLDRDDEAAGPSDRRFGLTFFSVFALAAILLRWRGSDWWPVPLGFAFACLALALLAPNRLRHFNRLWLKFGLVLHAVINPLVMGLLFYLVITPFGVFARLRGKDFLHLRFEPGATTYWIERRPPGPEPKTMNNQF